MGKTLVLNGTAHTVIGVMPSRFTWHDGDAWIPSPLDRSDPKALTTYRWFQGRLKPGVSRKQATVELNVIAQRIAKVYPQYYPKRFTIVLKTPVPTENPIQPSDACTYKNYPLILITGVLNSDFLILLPLYGSLPFSPSPCTLLFCASIGTDGGNPCTSPATRHSQPNR